MPENNVELLEAAIQFARAMHLRTILIESAGLFWLFAELVILFAVRLGRGHLETTPLPPHFTWTPQLTRSALIWAAAFLLLIAVTYGRHLVWPPAYAVLSRSPMEEAALRTLVLRRAHEHLVIWAAFVTGWVVLEALIVYHGWRGYAQLRRRVSESRA